jgi:hypothetical protein
MENKEVGNVAASAEDLVQADGGGDSVPDTHAGVSRARGVSWLLAAATTARLPDEVIVHQGRNAKQHNVALGEVEATARQWHALVR